MDDETEKEALIPATPSDADYAREVAEQSHLDREAAAPAGEAFAVEEDQGEVFTADDPVVLLENWLAIARRHEVNDANAMTLATSDADGYPNARVVLLKDIGPRGLSFYTNAESAKGRELEANPRAALCFHWKSIRRQVRVRGQVSALSPEESDQYFAARSRGAQLGAVASFQSRILRDRETLKRRIDDYDAIYQGRKIPRPDNWHGFLVAPAEMEFWVNRPYRLHERLLFTRAGEGWRQTRLYP